MSQLAVLLAFTGTGFAQEPPGARSDAAATGVKWRIVLEPKFMRRDVAFDIAGAKRMVLAPVTLTEDGDFRFPSKKEWEALNADWASVRRLAAQAAAEELRHLKPRYERNRKKVIEYAEIRTDQPIVASAVLAPKFLDLFADTLGPKVLVVVPNRYTAFVFPPLASDYQEYAPLVLEHYRASSFPVSPEVLEFSAEGIRAVGIFEEP